jgi:hypothetical protein
LSLWTFKWQLSGQRFGNSDDIVVVTIWLQVLDQDFFENIVNVLVSYWDKSIKRGGDYVEK